MLAGTSYASMSGFSTGSSQTSEASFAKTVEVPSWREGDPTGSNGPHPPSKGTFWLFLLNRLNPNAPPDVPNLLRKGES